MFALMGKVQSGQPAYFTEKVPGCVGAANYLGFNGVPAVAAALYLAGREHLKKNAGLAAAFYNEVQAPHAREACLVMTRLDLLADDTEVEVVNLWVEAASLSVLHTLANYDRATNDNVIMPFSSGCQSIWTLPFKEAGAESPRAVVGSLDPTVRDFLPPGAVSFSTPVARFVEMCNNIDGSFIAP